MIDLLFIGLLQAAMGEPQPNAPATDPAAEASAPADTQQAAPSANQPEIDPDDRPVCRNREVTGSRMPVRVCTTPAEQRYLDELNRGTMHRIQRPQPLTGG